MPGKCFTKAYCVLRALLHMAMVCMCYVGMLCSTDSAISTRSEEITYFMTFPAVVDGREHASVIPKRSVAFGGLFFIIYPPSLRHVSTLLER